MTPHSHDLSTTFGQTQDAGRIVDLSARVQAALTASGSLQEIGPLQKDTVSRAIEEHRCYVLKDESQDLIGCSFIKQIDENWYHQNDDFNIHAFAKPWLFLHSIMLEPELRGRGIGVNFLQDVIRLVEPSGGAILLDCWAGSEKLRSFYDRAGFQYVATLPENDYEIAVFIWSLSPRS